jgi:putative FmdB family regulatory protein
MPTYDYQCDACGGTFEKFQSIRAAPLRVCALCGKPRARRLIGAGAGLIFKGSGFYATDYRSDSYKSAAKAESPAASAKDAAPASKDKAAAPKAAPADRAGASKKP